ncbi:ligase-associated DNA damage response DEXH box helicase [Flavisolibacter tropicus]|uniref:DEAD/DEAH box helicase n=1 Tax=Flavisolibacter tropicus TaxID=1492898 RepID=A0A172TUF2_9BACT|nr:ligase-associated DNA damage response DEXH box helicase [Flavisolibacter tropicus]ANE50598.1 DEAD/DEAH box helicase [Flavisolibacter tropicus]
MKLHDTKGYHVIKDWLAQKDFRPFAFQEEAWAYINEGRSGLVNAPTGTGKTFSVFLGALIQFINQHPDNYKAKAKNGLQLLWITPLRALAKDIGRAMEDVIAELGMSWQVGIRNGDTSVSDRQKQKRQMPEALIITPESLHLLLAQKGYPEVLKDLKIIAADEWHELMGSKRGVQVELALSRICGLVSQQLRDVSLEMTDGEVKGKRKRQEKVAANYQLPTTNFSIWGISATIGNLNQAMDVLLHPLQLVNPTAKGIIVRANIHKQIEIESILPDEIEKYPWAGHLGIKLAKKVLPIIENSRTTLIFINTRGMSELWYQTLLNIAPELAGLIALHHGSIEMELRTWVEEALHEGKLKAVVCTASLDLGVDFRPVETVIQVGSPKGVARFLQRAGRSGHQPDAVSRIYFLPTHSLELIEAAALKAAVAETTIESREPLLLCYDVLIQYLCTLAISEGFVSDALFQEVKATNCFQELTEDEWQEMLHFITVGGNALQQYDEYKKAEVENGVYRITSRRIAMRHRMHIGTIVSDAMIKVKFMTGGYIGVIEEYFISRLEPGDTFTLAGRNLELIMIKDMTVLVKKSNAKKSVVPSWLGGRLPLSQSLGKILREKLNEAGAQILEGVLSDDVELQALMVLFEVQERLSHIPRSNELLIEQIETADGFHLFVYPFEGRLVHEAMAALLAYRISKLTPITFSIAMNDYGFELLSDQPIPVDDSNVYQLFSLDNLLDDIQRSVNSTEMAKRKFRDIAVIGGLIFQGYPGEYKKQRHLQASAGLLFNVFNEYEPGNVLIRQAYQEVFDQQMEEMRLRDMLERIQQSKIILTFPQRLTPFCFPIKVDSMRENLTSEKLEDRVRRMQQQLEK